MPYYGRRRYYPKRRRTRGRFVYQKRAKARKATNRRAVKGRAKNIQSAVKAPMSRMIMFEDTRSFIVDDNDGTATTGPEPIQRIFELNNPQNTFPTATSPPAARAVQGTWTSADYAGKGAEMPGLERWVTKKDGTGAGQYRMATATSAKVVITAVPIEEDGVDAKSKQAITRLFVKKITKLSDGTAYMNKQPQASFNCDVIARQPYTRTQDMIRAEGARNKGATITMSYNFKRLNSGPGRVSLNHFFSDAAPTELDFLHIGILPTNASSYGLNTNRCGKYRVVVKFQTLAHLSEPNTDGTNWGESDGNTMARIKRKYTTVMGGDQPGEDE